MQIGGRAGMLRGGATRPQAGGCRGRSTRLHVVAKAKASATQQQVLAVGQQPVAAPANCWMPPAIAFGVAVAFSLVILQRREPKQAVTELPPLPRKAEHKDDPRMHQRALARARQASHVSKAVGLLKASEPAKVGRPRGSAGPWVRPSGSSSGPYSLQNELLLLDDSSHGTGDAHVLHRATPLHPALHPRSPTWSSPAP